MRYALIIMFLMLTGSVAAQVPGMGGPPPDLREQMEEARSTARTGIMNSLSADHRTQVNAIVSSFEGGNLSMCEAAERIDGVLSASESASAVAQAQKMRESFHGPPGAPSMQRPAGMGRHKPDAGEIVLMVAALP